MGDCSPEVRREWGRLFNLRNAAYLRMLQKWGKSLEPYRRDLDAATANLQAYERQHGLKG